MHPILPQIVPFLRILAVLAVCLLPAAAPVGVSAAAAPAPAEKADPDGKDAAARPKAAQRRPLSETLVNFLATQRITIDDAVRMARDRRAGFAEIAAGIAGQLQPARVEYGRLLVLRGSMAGWPSGLDAVRRGLAAAVADLEEKFAPAARAHDDLLAAQEKVSRVKEGLEDVEKGDTADFSDDLRPLLDGIAEAQKLLTPLVRRHERALAPAHKLLTDMKATLAEIDKAMPEAWRNYYLRGPERWYDAGAWREAAWLLGMVPQTMDMRLASEIPLSADDRRAAVLRGLLTLLLALAAVLILRRRFGAPDDPEIGRGFARTAFWLCLGAGLTGAAFSSQHGVFHLFLAAGSICLIVGQMILAWNLRRIQLPGLPPGPSPLRRLLPPTLCAYLILYLPLPRVLALGLWLATLAATIILRRQRLAGAEPMPEAAQEPSGAAPDAAQAGNVPAPDTPDLENAVMAGAGALLMCSLGLTLCGLHVYGMALYLLYSSCSLALQLGVAGMAICGRINDRLPEEGGGAAAGVLLALLAPCLLVLAFAGVSLWLVTLPGGTVLLKHYVLQGDMSVGETQFNLIQVLLIISAFFITRTAVRMGAYFLQRLAGRASQFDTTLIPPVRATLTYAAWAVFGLFSLRSLGVELSSLAVVAGGLSVGIGFGMQNVVNNFVSGMLLIFSRSIQVGDTVEVGGTVGRVRRISIRATVVETYEGAMIFVPNSEFVSGRLVNWTRSSRMTRREVKVGVAYGSDTELVSRLLIQAASSTDNVLRYPQPTVFFSDFGASSLDFSLRFWVQDYDLALGTASAVRRRVDALFREHGVDVPFPQSDIHVKDMPPRRPATPLERDAGPHRRGIRRVPSGRAARHSPDAGR